MNKAEKSLPVRCLYSFGGDRHKQVNMCQEFRINKHCVKGQQNKRMDSSKTMGGGWSGKSSLKRWCLSIHLTKVKSKLAKSGRKSFLGRGNSQCKDGKEPDLFKAEQRG